MNEIETLRGLIPVSRLCDALGMPRSTYYNCRKNKPSKTRRTPAKEPRQHPRGLTRKERAEVVRVLMSEMYIDKSPGQIVANQLDEGRYICSERTYYRILHEHNAVGERRAIARRSTFSAPELMATAPRMVWTWDITKLKGHKKGIVYNLYVILDMYSRYVVGWLLAHREQDNLAVELIEASCRREGIQPSQLVIHADRGSSMRSASVSALYDRMHITKSHSRPYCSNDNPYSESQFKTMKYSSRFPDRFESIEAARLFCERFFDEYNNEMYHSGLAMLTPAAVHFGRVEEVVSRRQLVLTQAFQSHPERFVNGKPTHRTPPQKVWINKPINIANHTLNS
ncbi:MAG: IS3 family transposase [Ignavibacteria bacterium]|nr:IS3 family transposase [Ignavibacteria bacterium]